MPVNFKGGGVVFHEPRNEDGSLIIYSAWTDLSPVGETFLALYDLSGRLHHGSGSTSAALAGFVTCESRFPKINTKDVKSVELRARFYDWATFRNVSLEPGHMTNPEADSLSRSSLVASSRAPDPSSVSGLPGQQVEEFELQSLDGKTHRLNNYQGKLVLLHFFATWCRPCLAEMPRLVQLQQQYGEKGLAVLAVSWKDDRRKLSEYADKNPLPFPILFDAKSTLLERFPDESGKVSVPTNILIAPTGRILHADRGFDASALRELRQVIDSALAGRSSETE
jgi:peroxiredoxin